MRRAKMQIVADLAFAFGWREADVDQLAYHEVETWLTLAAERRDLYRVR